MQKYYTEISEELLKYTNIENNTRLTIPFIMQKILYLEEKDRISIMYNLNKINKNLPFDLLNLYIENLRLSYKLKNCYPFVVGPEYLLVTSLIRRRLNMKNSEDKFSDVEDFSKKSIYDRNSYKDYKDNLNINYDIYSDVKRYIEQELENQIEIEKIKISSSKIKIDVGVDKIYDLVFDDINEMITSSIVSDKKFYIGLTILREERLKGIVKKFKEFENHLI